MKYYIRAEIKKWSLDKQWRKPGIQNWFFKITDKINNVFARWTKG